jgi:hypothetical protein
MRVARIRVRMGTVDLPDRTLNDTTEQSVDVIDIQLEPGERVEHITLEKQYGYTMKETNVPKHSGELHDAMARPQLSSPDVSEVRPHRDKSKDHWRFRAVQEIDGIDAETGDLLLPGANFTDPGEPIQDAEVMGEIEPSG